MGLSPSPTFADVDSDHEMDVLAHQRLEGVFGDLENCGVIQNGCGWEGEWMRVMQLDSGVFES